jgi:hypothetical protein
MPTEQSGAEEQEEVLEGAAEEEVVEEQEGAEQAEEEGEQAEEEQQEEAESELYEVDVPDGKGGFETETIDINDLPSILAGARKLQLREQELEAQQQQLSSYSALLNFVTTDNLTKAIANYRLQGVSEFEAIEAVYNYYLQNGMTQTSQQVDDDIDPRIKELRDKVKRYDEFFENQEKTRNIEENNKFLAQEAINLGYRVDEADLPVVIEEANKVAYQIFAEIAPDIPPEQYTALRKVTPSVARAIWDETSRRLQGRFNGQQETASKPVVRKFTGAKQVQKATNKTKPAPPRVISGKRGTDVTSSKATKAAPVTQKGSTSKDRAQALRALFGATE